MIPSCGTRNRPREDDDAAGVSPYRIRPDDDDDDGAPGTLTRPRALLYTTLTPMYCRGAVDG